MFVKSQIGDRKATFGSGFEKKSLLKKISEMQDLPALDVNIAKIITLIRNENVRIDDLVDAIGRDHGLVAKILKLINSGYYSLRHTVTTVERAVVLLGILNIKQVVYSASIMDFYSYDDIVEWNHAYTSSYLMTTLMQEGIFPPAPNLPLAMLMHDIGKVVLRRFSPDKFKAAVALSIEERIPVFQAEEIVIGIDHAEVGSMLLEKWGMPAETFVPVGEHHVFREQKEYAFEIALVNLVNWIDSMARSINCIPPNPDFLNETGLGNIDANALVERQREFIGETEKKEDRSNR
jgi:HD-like signal output (HDOD) protein